MSHHKIFILLPTGIEYFMMANTMWQISKTKIYK